MSIFGTALLMLALQALPVQGIVVKKGTNEPLSDAVVELRLERDNGPLKSVTTEDDGRFLFESVAPGRYRITATRRGYTRSPLTINIAAQQAAPEIQLPMTQAGTISGRVYDPNGQPLGNVEVLAMKAAYPDGRRILTPVRSAVTNDLGEYRLFWLPPGRYFVSAIHPKAQGMFRQMINSFAPGLVATGTSFGGIGGTLNSSAKTDPAVSMLELDTSERYAPVFFGGTTDERSASAVDIRAGTEVTGANIMIAQIRLRHVRGIVTDGLTGRPAQYGSLTVVTEADAPPGRPELQVDRDKGTFDLLLLPGSHTVSATSASGEGSVTFQLLDVDIENLVIPTSATFDIAGRIGIEGEPNAGSSLGALHMMLRAYPPRPESRTAGFSYSNPLPDGSFVVSGSAGDYRLNIEPLLNVTPPRLSPATLPAALQNAYVKSIRLGNVDALNAPLHLEGKPSALLEVVIGKNSGAIDGQVVTDRGTSAADVSVVLIPDVRRRTELYRTATTDVSGRFHFDRVPPGEYKVFSWEEVQDGAWYDPEFLRANENRGTQIRIIEGRTDAVRVELIP